jgi:hypothetical protein
MTFHNIRLKWHKKAIQNWIVLSTWLNTLFLNYVWLFDLVVRRTGITFDGGVEGLLVKEDPRFPIHALFQAQTGTWVEAQSLYQLVG